MVNFMCLIVVRFHFSLRKPIENNISNEKRDDLSDTHTHAHSSSLVFLYYTVDKFHLEEEAKEDPLVVANIAPLLGVDGQVFLYYTVDKSYLEEEAEADPLVVADIAPLLGVDGFVYAGMSHIDPDPLPEGAGDGVGGVDPAVRVQHVLWNVLGVNTVDGVAHILPEGRGAAGY